MAESEKQEKTEKDLERMTVKELRTIAAEEIDVAGIHSMKKAELVTAITEAKGITEETAPEETAPEEKAPEEKAPQKKAIKEELTSKDLKAKIAELKVKKEGFRKARDGRMVEALRRRINRAKKRTRKL